MRREEKRKKDGKKSRGELEEEEKRGQKKEEGLKSPQSSLKNRQTYIFRHANCMDSGCVVIIFVPNGEDHQMINCSPLI